MSRARDLVQQYGAAEVVRALEPLVLEERFATLEQVIAQRRKDLTVLADRFYDPHNNAAILRSSEAFGLCAMHAVPGEQGASLAHSVTQGVEKWIDFVVHPSFDAAADSLEAEGYLLVGADMDGELPEALPAEGRLCLVMGAEKRGLLPEARRRCQRLVRVPMVGMVESFNVSVAAALLMYALTERRRPERLSAEEKTERLACYLVQTVQRPATILAKLL